MVALFYLSLTVMILAGAFFLGVIAFWLVKEAKSRPELESSDPPSSAPGRPKQNKH